MPNRSQTLVGAALVVCAVVCWWPVLDQPFLEYDDAVYVFRNPAVLGGLSFGGLERAFLGFHAANWHPVTWLSHQLDVTLFGLAPRGHHATSLCLHALNSLLLFLWLDTATQGAARRRCAFVGAVFALHPVAVDSVAWVAERKNLLAVFFGLMTLLAWTRYTRQPSVGRYALVAASLALGLMSKPMLVTLPVLLVCVDFWPLARFGARPLRLLIVEKLPLLALAVVTMVLTVMAQDAGGAVEGLEPFPLSLRLMNAVVAFPTYVGLILWPAWPSQLAILHPHPGEALSATRAGLALVGGLAGVALVVRLGRTRPYLWMGLAWLLVSLLPVLGIVQVGAQSHAERYAYLPMVGLLVAVTWGSADLARALRVPRRLVGPAAVIVLLALGLASRQELSYWRDESSLFARAIEVYESTGVKTRHAMILYYQLGHVLQRDGKHREAVEAYREAVSLNPEDPRPHNNLGSSLDALGQTDAAAAAFARALVVAPGHPTALFNLASVASQRGESAQARDLILRFLRGGVHSPERRARALRLLLEQDPAAAAAILRGGPGDPPSLALLSEAEARLGRDAEAISALERALAVEPTSRVLRNNLAFLLVTSRDRRARRPREALAIMEGLAAEAPLDVAEQDTWRAVQAATRPPRP